jgi:hypothetical protein
MHQALDHSVHRRRREKHAQLQFRMVEDAAKQRGQAPMAIPAH